MFNLPSSPPANPPATTWHPTLESLFDCWRRFFLAHRSPEALSSDLLHVVAEATHATRASLMLFDPEQRELTIAASFGLDEAGLSCVPLGEGIAGWVALHRQPLLLPGGRNLPPQLQKLLCQETITSALCLPMEVDGELCGVLNLARCGPLPPFTAEDLWFATLIAERQAVALHTARLYGELARREQFINRILESIPVSLVVLDRQLRVVSANQNFLNKARRDGRQTIGQSLNAVLPPVLLSFTRLEEEARAVLVTGQPFEGDKLAYRASGHASRTYYYRLIPLKGAGAVDHVMLLMEDITEREQLSEEMRRVERHLASVVDCASDLVVSMTPEGQIVTWNLAAERVSGLAAKDVCGQSFSTLCAGDQRRTLDGLLQRLRGGVDGAEAEITLLSANPRQEVSVAWNCSAMRDEHRNLMAIVAVGRDLTERRRLEAQIVQSAKIASLGVMAGGIAHELRNPLAIISAGAQLLQEHQDDPELIRAGTQKIIASAQRASLIIEHLLKFGHPPAERFRLLDLNAVLDDTLEMLQHQLLIGQIALTRAFAPDLPSIYGNPELLTQVFTNLILNACSAMSHGGCLTVRTRAAGERVEAAVSDTGRGISPTELPKIFDPFYTTGGVGQGTGLGLSICYSIVRQHHGLIEAHSQVGRGSTFVVTLPILPE